MRGFASIGLVRPKHPANVGGVLRAAQVYGASLVAIQGDRTKMTASSDTTKAYRHLPCLRSNDLFSLCPYGAVPVGIDKDRRSANLSSAIRVFVLKDVLGRVERRTA